MSTLYTEAPVQLVDLQRALPPGTDYSGAFFEMRLFHDEDLVVNGPAYIDRVDVRIPSPILGKAVALTEETVTRAILYYEGAPLAVCNQTLRPKKGDLIGIHWWIANGPIIEWKDIRESNTSSQRN